MLVARNANASTASAKCAPNTRALVVPDATSPVRNSRATSSALPAAAEPVGERPPQQLREGEAGQKYAQAGADRAGGNLQFLPHGAKGRQVHIN